MHLIVDPFASDDVAELMTWFPDMASVVQWAGPRLRAPLDHSQFQSLLDTPDQEGTWRAWTVRKSGHQVVGHFELLFDPICGQATLGRVAIAPNARGKGYAAPLVQAALEIAFGRDDIHRVELRVFDFNAAAVAVYERLGFVREGTCRDAVRVGPEAWNVHIMSLLRREWNAVTLDDRTTSR
ncbi:GNAT family protein [Ochrobactrum vermis]|uniref:GNAT family protein n=1 Tax=Ochrobactrum vermis TaxID=1827297 RepID=A0ABU8PGZ5_9HYPH|nr:GNAT family protein [Ochrobactrum vermis]PQZ25365.1 GNAT family N-acetyltransferase [Ochrobactrum vermis]